MGVSGGCEPISIGAKLKFEGARAKKLLVDLVNLGLKNARNA